MNTSRASHIHCYDSYPDGDVEACVTNLETILEPGDVVTVEGKTYGALPAFNRANELVVLRDLLGAQIATEVVAEPSRHDLETSTRREVPV